MKKLMLIPLIIIAISMDTFAQRDAISKFFSEYEENRDFTVITISGRMFKAFADIETDDPEDQRVMDAISKLTGLKIMSLSNTSKGFEMYRDATSKISTKGYEEIMTVRESDHDLKFYVLESNELISELVMISGGKNEFTILSLVGIINLDDLSDLSKSLEIEGLEELEKVNDKKQKN